MKLQQRGEERIAATPEVVWSFVSDANKIAECVPNATELTVHDPSRFDAVVLVSVGPVRGKFKFKFTLTPHEPDRRVAMKIAGGGLGSTIDLTANADVVPAGDGVTNLNWVGEAEIRGAVAAVGGRVIEGQAQKLIAQTFAAVRTRLSNPSGAPQAGVAG